MCLWIVSLINMLCALWITRLWNIKIFYTICDSSYTITHSATREGSPQKMDLSLNESLTSLLFCVHFACLKISLVVYFFFYKYHANKPFNINLLISISKGWGWCRKEASPFSWISRIVVPCPKLLSVCIWKLIDHQQSKCFLSCSEERRRK